MFDNSSDPLNGTIPIAIPIPIEEDAVDTSLSLLFLLALLYTIMILSYIFQRRKIRVIHETVEVLLIAGDIDSARHELWIGSYLGVSLLDLVACRFAKYHQDGDV